MPRIEYECSVSMGMDRAIEGDREMNQSCSCEKCIEACRRFPGWMTIAEAAAMIAAGMGDKLMLDWMEPSEKLGTTSRIYVLCPASKHHEGGLAPGMDEFYPDNNGSFLETLLITTFNIPPVAMPCTLLVDGKCSIHDTSFKPIMCRELMQCQDIGIHKFDMAPEWDSEAGRSLVADWCRHHDVDLAEADAFA